MKLPLYVIKNTLLAMMGGVIGLWLLQAIFAYLSELENLSDSYTAIQALWYTIYRMPYFFVQFVGTGVLLGAVVGLGLLAGNSEIVVMRAAGISLYRIVGWAMVPAFLFVVLSLLVNEYVLPKTQILAKDIKYPYENTLILHEFWAVTPTDAGRQIVNIKKADDKGELSGIRQFELADGELVHALHAKHGYANDANSYTWSLHDIHQINIGQAASTTADKETLLSLPISRHAVHLLTKEAEDLSVSELYAHRQLMAYQQTRSKRHELAFWQKLLSPFSVLSLLLVACSFVFGSLRSQSLGLRVVMALLTGLLFSYLTDLTGFIALATSAPPLLMVLLPVLISAGVGMYLLSKK